MQTNEYNNPQMTLISVFFLLLFMIKHTWAHGILSEIKLSKEFD